MRPCALITGASRGIGKEVAYYFADEGYDLILVARNEAALNALKAALIDKHDEIDVIVKPLDLSGDTTSVYNDIKACIDAKGRLDVLFNNAGILINGTLEVSLADFEQMHQVNINGLFAVAKAAAHMMKQQKSGYIFNLASLLGKRTITGFGAYASTKFAVVALSDTLSKELASHGIKVTSLCPSVTDTDMTSNFDLPGSEKIQVADIAKTVDYLLSLSASAIVSTVDIHCRELLAQMP